MIRRDEVVIAVDGDKSYKSEGDLLVYFAQQKQSGDTVTVTIIRGKEQIEVEVKVQ